jgi:hypothetical protein
MVVSLITYKKDLAGSRQEVLFERTRPPHPLNHHASAATRRSLIISIHQCRQTGGCPVYVPYMPRICLVSLRYGTSMEHLRDKDGRKSSLPEPGTRYPKPRRSNFEHRTLIPRTPNLKPQSSTSNFEPRTLNART